jgi:2-polyprenyl-3-methyl-5-hydroxy-6-metoxy-1,4-benzoquinol methylase
MKMYSKSVPFSNKILKDNIPSGKVLDVGGAYCPVRSRMLAEYMDEVAIVDPNTPRVGLSENITHYQYRVEDLSVEECGLFDHIVLSNVLEHIDEPLAALKAVEKLLEDDGKIHILTPNCESLNRRIGVLMGAMEHIRVIPPNEVAIGHVQTFTVADMRDLVQRAGFKIDLCQGVFLKPVPTPEMIEWPEERIKAFFEIAKTIPPDLCHEVYFKCLKN